MSVKISPSEKPSSYFVKINKIIIYILIQKNTIQFKTFAILKINNKNINNLIIEKVKINYVESNSFVVVFGAAKSLLFSRLFLQHQRRS